MTLDRIPIKGNPAGGHFSRAEWFALPLEFRRRWWRETDYSHRPPSDQLLAELHVLLHGPLRPRPAADDPRELKLAMAAAHPDHGGNSAAFIAAHAAYVAAHRRARGRRP